MDSAKRSTGALRERAGPALALELQAGGMYPLAGLPRGVDDAEFVARLVRHGVAPTPLSACRVKSPCALGLLIVFTNVDARQAARAAQRLIDALDLPEARRPSFDPFARAVRSGRGLLHR